MKKISYSNSFLLAFGVLFCLLLSGEFTGAQAMGYPHRLFGSKRVVKTSVTNGAAAKTSRSTVSTATPHKSVWGLHIPTLFQLVQSSRD